MMGKDFESDFYEDDDISFYGETAIAYSTAYKIFLMETNDVDRAERMVKDWWRGMCSILKESNGFTAFWDNR